MSLILGSDSAGLLTAGAAAVGGAVAAAVITVGATQVAVNVTQPE